MAFRWTNSVEGFDMPVKVYFEKGKATVLNPTNSWQEVAANGGGFFGIDEDFYVESKRVE